MTTILINTSENGTCCLPELTHFCFLSTCNNKNHPEFQPRSQILKMCLIGNHSFPTDRMDNLLASAQLISFGAGIHRWAVSCRTHTHYRSFVSKHCGEDRWEKPDASPYMEHPLQDSRIKGYPSQWGIVDLVFWGYPEAVEDHVLGINMFSHERPPFLPEPYCLQAHSAIDMVPSVPFKHSWSMAANTF